MGKLFLIFVGLALLQAWMRGVDTRRLSVDVRHEETFAVKDLHEQEYIETGDVHQRVKRSEPEKINFNTAYSYEPEDHNIWLANNKPVHTAWEPTDFHSKDWSQTWSPDLLPKTDPSKGIYVIPVELKVYTKAEDEAYIAQTQQAKDQHMTTTSTVHDESSKHTDLAQNGHSGTPAATKLSTEGINPKFHGVIARHNQLLEQAQNGHDSTGKAPHASTPGSAKDSGKPNTFNRAKRSAWSPDDFAQESEWELSYTTPVTPKPTTQPGAPDYEVLEPKGSPAPEEKITVLLVLKYAAAPITLLSVTFFTYCMYRLCVTTNGPCSCCCMSPQKMGQSLVQDYVPGAKVGKDGKVEFVQPSEEEMEALKNAVMQLA